MGLCFSDTAGGGEETAPAAATIERGEGRGGLPTITLKHASGATASITEFGATLVSYKAASGREVLFVSGEALFNGVKAIRKHQSLGTVLPGCAKLCRQPKRQQL